MEEERVVGDAAHGVVGDAGGDGAAGPGRVGEEGVEAALAALNKEGISTRAARRQRCER